MHEVVERDLNFWERDAAVQTLAVQTLLGALRENVSLFDSFFMSSPAGLAILDANLRFHRVNGAWAQISGVPAEAHLGKRLRDVIPGLAGQIEPAMRDVLLTGQRKRNLEICGTATGAEDSVSHWLVDCFPIRTLAGEISAIGCVFLDITDCRRAEESLRVGQCLAAIKMNLDTLDRCVSKENLDPRTAKALTEAVSLAEQCSSDTRTISYLLHPPLLDERGLASAIRWYGDGFAQRSGIRLSMDLPTEEMRLPQAVETTLFRIVQESLTNIHRHSGSTMAEIRLLADAEAVVLEVHDRGRGIPALRLRRYDGAGRAVGVGIAGMRERVRQFGGRLDISSSSQGTLVRATLPLGGEA